MFFYQYQDASINASIGENLTFPQHMHSHIELVYILDGEVSASVNGVTKLLHKDDICFCFPNTLHSYESNGHDRNLTFIFDCTIVPYFKNKLLSYNSEIPFLESGEYNTEIRKLLLTVAELANSNGSIDLIAGNMNLAIAMILNKLTLVKCGNSSKYSEWFLDVIDYISNNYEKRITLDDISKQVSISSYYLSRKFTQYMKCSITTYINQLRVSNAINLLRMTDKNVAEISYECGFENIRSFNRAYKQITGETPRQLRENKT